MAVQRMTREAIEERSKSKTAAKTRGRREESGSDEGEARSQEGMFQVHAVVHVRLRRPIER